jgi:Ca2+-binding EF-hand superfamily protein
MSNIIGVARAHFLFAVFQSKSSGTVSIQEVKIMVKMLDTMITSQELDYLVSKVGQGSLNEFNLDKFLEVCKLWNNQFLEAAKDAMSMLCLTNHGN